MFDKLWRYNDWANRSLIRSIEQQDAEIPEKSLKLLSHIMNTQMIWTDRVRGERPNVGVWELHDMDTCIRMHEQASAKLRQIIIEHAENMQQIISYTNTAGIAFENELEDIIMHVFNHGTYHRGQIAQDLRINALEPILTDYIVFTR